MYVVSKESGGSAVSHSPPSKIVVGSGSVVDVDVDVVLDDVDVFVDAASVVLDDSAISVPSDEEHEATTHAAAKTATVRRKPFIRRSDYEVTSSRETTRHRTFHFWSGKGITGEND